MSEQLKLDDTDKADKVVEKRENISIILDDYGQPSREVFYSERQVNFVKSDESNLSQRFPQARKEDVINRIDRQQNFVEDEELNKMLQELQK
jgi:hypothetical protein